MTEKAEKTQFEGIIKEDKVIISEREGIEDFYNTSYIGTIEKNVDGQKFLILEAIEVLLLSERNRILLWEDNDKSRKLLDFEDLLTYFTQFKKS
ncbi:MAG: hypothetical protein ACFE85_16620 [Candidatus Hodarchaeota archaeon]